MKSTLLAIGRSHLQICTLAALLSATATAQAAVSHGEILATLSEAKARAEGRARLLTSCAARSKTATVPIEIQTTYEDAKAAFNARIEWLSSETRSKKLKELDVPAALSQLNVALNKVDRFVLIADAQLVKNKCDTLRKVSWAKIAALVLTPEMVKAVLEFFSSKDTSDVDREEFIFKIESQKLLDWAKIRVFVAYDWKTATFYSGDDITAELLRKGGTAIYVNEWGLSNNALDKATYAKELPLGLSKSYFLFAGDPKVVLDQSLKRGF